MACQPIGDPKERPVITGHMTPLADVAAATADLLIYSGFAPTLGDDKVEALADMLAAFLKAGDVSVDEAGSAAYFASAREYSERWGLAAPTA
jgi:hypothetical protein